MSNQQILTKAIEKAIAGGWTSDDPMFLSADAETAEEYMEVIDKYCFDCFVNERLFNTIFNHDFAKSLFGEYPTRIPAYSDALENWQFHLQNMVIAPDPIEYIGNFLESEK